MTYLDFTAWCKDNSTGFSLYIKSLGGGVGRPVWTRGEHRWDGRDPYDSFYQEFGFLLAGWHDGRDPLQEKWKDRLDLFSILTKVSGHEAANMAQRSLQLMGPARFGLPDGYGFDLRDGQLAITLEDRLTPGVVLWDGVIRSMLIGSPLPVPTHPGPAPAPIPAPTPSPTPPGPATVLPPLAPAAQRVRELEEVAVRFLPSFALPRLLTETMLRGALVLLRPVTTDALKVWRLARQVALNDPRPAPAADREARP